MKKIVGLALAFALGLLPAAFAQGAKGSIYGKVVDESGAVMPGATVTLTGANIGAMTTNALGPGRLPVPEPRQRDLQDDGGPHRVRHPEPRGQRQRRGQRGPALPPQGGHGRGDHHRLLRDPGRRHQEERHLDHPHPGGARRHPELPRSLGGAPHHPRRARGPAEHRGLRERPAVVLHRQGLGPGRHPVDARRRRDQRRGRRRLLPDLLRLRRLRPDQRHHRRHRRQDGDGRPRPQLRDQARDQQLPRQPRRLPGPRQAPVGQRARRAGGRPAPARAATRPTTPTRSPTTASTSAAPSSRTSSGSSAATASRTSACGGSTRPRTRPC